MKRLTITGFLLVALFFGGTANAADAQKGLDAYNKGDYQTALQEFNPLAKENHKGAQFVLGVMYAKGQGVEQNHKTAVKWYQRAAKQGHAKAQHGLGIAYISGNQGVKPSHKQAIKWFNLAAEQGLALSQHSLGVIYISGQGGAKKDIKKAAQWFKKAAEQGLPEAQHGLGASYLMGQNLPVDEVTAYLWLDIAAQKNYAEAKKLRDTIEEKMSKDDVKIAKKRAKQCVKSNYKDC